jgi:nanoRNase/pAp phosphatase (c-di-AMP/oligoRNAs hydrolase)
MLCVILRSSRENTIIDKETQMFGGGGHDNSIAWLLFLAVNCAVIAAVISLFSRAAKGSKKQ